MDGEGKIFLKTFSINAFSLHDLYAWTRQSTTTPPLPQGLRDLQCLLARPWSLKLYIILSCKIVDF